MSHGPCQSSRRTWKRNPSNWQTDVLLLPSLLVRSRASMHTAGCARCQLDGIAVIKTILASSLARFSFCHKLPTLIKTYIWSRRRLGIQEYRDVKSIQRGYVRQSWQNSNGFIHFISKHFSILWHNSCPWKWYCYLSNNYLWKVILPSPFSSLHIPFSISYAALYSDCSCLK